VELADLAIPDHANGAQQEVGASGNQRDPPNKWRITEEMPHQRGTKADSAKDA
jgi:hypothetical protein